MQAFSGKISQMHAFFFHFATKRGKMISKFAKMKDKSPKKRKRDNDVNTVCV